MSSKRYDDSQQWYAIHTYSGYEEKVAESIRQRINGVDMADKIFDVIVPKEKQIQIRNGKRKIVEAKIFQGYVLVEMKLTDETWYIIAKMKKRMGVEEPKHQIDFAEGEIVSITDGPFKGFDGAVSEIDASKGTLKVMVSMFGRDTPVELDALQVKKAQLAIQRIFRYNTRVTHYKL